MRPVNLAAGGLEARLAGQVGDLTLDAAFSLPISGVTAIVGPSGAGKTTLLRCIAGLIRLPGRLMVEGETWQAEGRFVAPHKRAVAYVCQEARLFAHLSVRRNLLFGYRRAAGPKRFSFDEVVDGLALAPLLHRSTAKLSGGERQRIAIGRALLAQPRLLLLDEPLSSLDEASKADILAYLQAGPKAQGLPMLYVSHAPAEIERLADRSLQMSAGRLQAEAIAEPHYISDRLAG